MHTAILAAFAAAFVVCAAVLGALVSRRQWLAGWHDIPNARSLHSAPVPRLGGLGIHAAVAVLWVAGALRGLPPVFGWTGLAGLAAVFAVSMVDDRRSVGPLPRLLVQALAAAALVADLWPIGPAAAVLAVPAMLAVLWAMNLYNFMDGADGLAGGMAVFGFGTYAWLAADVSPALAWAAAACAGAAAGFLVFNIPPARLFMGDAGSVPLGCLAAGLGLAGVTSGAWGWWLPPLVFLPFAADATFTLAHRALRGARVWEAHREHAYQRLVRMGWTHRHVMLAAYAAMAGCAGAAVVLARLDRPAQWAGLLLMTGLAGACWLAVQRRWSRFCAQG